VITGKLWTALYFFWIVLGLALLTPLLVPWVATAGRRAQLVAAAAAYAVPLLTLITVPLRDAPISWMETAWTWWIPYLGYYLLGHALREVVVRGPMLVVPAVAAVAGTVLLIVQWRRSTGVLGALETYVPAESYYAPTVLVVTVSVFLLGRALVRPGGLLRALSTGATARVARRLGDATLGVFASHLLVLEVVLRLPVIGGPRGADSVGQLLARCVVVLLGAYVLALVASRLPLLRRVV
jgi:surface polysaccharide O-acyltransferase-like enzyme